MKVCGVVSEFNPFHNGHRYLISEIKKSGYDAVVCVMSGNFVQRGEYAFCHKKIRAQCAVRGGADLVVSIPFPWSCATAELFAENAVSILERLGIVDSIAFGSESGDIDKLSICADFLSSLTSGEIIKYQKSFPKMSYADARERIVENSLGAEFSKLMSSPNDILAIEYIKALKKSGSNITPLAIKRVGSDHRGEVFGSEICSSSRIRELYASNRAREASEFISSEDADILSSCARSVNNEKYADILRGAVLSREPQELSAFAEIGGGFEFAIYRELLVANSFDAFMSALKARHLTDAKIRRALLYLSLGVKKEYVSEQVQFTEVLASNEIGRSLLASCRKSRNITILSKNANIKDADDVAKSQFKLQRKAEMLFDKISEIL